MVGIEKFNCVAHPFKIAKGWATSTVSEAYCFGISLPAAWYAVSRGMMIVPVP